MAMSDNIVLTRRDEIEALLPFYLTGALDGDDLDRVEAWIANDAEAEAALAAVEAELDATIAANESVRPPADALTRFAALLEVESPAPRPSALAIMLRRLRVAAPTLGWAAAAALLAVVAVQTLGPAHRGDGTELAGAGGNAADGPFALIAFRADTPFDRVAAILTETGASIIDGPKPGGFFRVAIPAASRAEYDRIVERIDEAGVIDAMMPGRAP